MVCDQRGVGVWQGRDREHTGRTLSPEAPKRGEVGLSKERAGHRRGDRARRFAIDLIAKGTVSSGQKLPYERLEGFGLFGVSILMAGQPAMQRPRFFKTLAHLERLLAHHATEMPVLSF